MTDMNNLVSAMKAAAPDPVLRRRMGAVVAINSDRTINVTIAGSTTTITSVKYFGHYAPKVGAQVWLDTDGRDWVAIGAIAGLGGAVPTCKVYRTADQNIATGSTFVNVSWQAAAFDPWGMWTSGTNVTVPITGRYLINSTVQFNAVTPYTVSYRSGRIYQNGGPLNIVQTDSPVGNVLWSQSLSIIVNATAGDYFTLGARQNSGITISIASSAASETQMTVTYLGPDA